MRQRHFLGMILLLSSIICSCTKIGDENLIDGHLKYITFGFGETKAVKSFNWASGDKVCVYSLQDGIITYKDTVVITQPNGNTCKIKALVDVDATEYFATYPFNAVKSEVGEPLDDEALNVVYNGRYRDVSIMTCYAKPKDKDLWFRQRLSLLQIDNTIGSVNGEITIDSSLPVVHSFRLGAMSQYYIPISYRNESVTITFKTDNTKRKKTMTVESGRIYESRWTIN